MSTTPGASDSPVGQITLRYWASARAAAHVDEDRIDVDGRVSLEELRARARELHDSARFRDVLATCSVIVGDRPATTEDPASVLVDPGQTVEFLPPFAGG